MSKWVLWIRFIGFVPAIVYCLFQFKIKESGEYGKAFILSSEYKIILLIIILVLFLTAVRYLDEYIKEKPFTDPSRIKYSYIKFTGKVAVVYLIFSILTKISGRVDMALLILVLSHLISFPFLLLAIKKNKEKEEE
jgi:ABC-type phosphate/phosphonate transport system permease subunit